MHLICISPLFIGSYDASYLFNPYDFFFVVVLSLVSFVLVKDLVSFSLLLCFIRGIQRRQAQ